MTARGSEGRADVTSVRLRELNRSLEEDSGRGNGGDLYGCELNTAIHLNVSSCHSDFDKSSGYVLYWTIGGFSVKFGHDVATVRLELLKNITTFYDKWEMKWDKFRIYTLFSYVCEPW
jgi:hypothetical protein